MDACQTSTTATLRAPARRTIGSRFAYDDRPVHPIPEEQHPLESLAGRGQTEGTPMGLGLGLGWTILAVAGAFGLLILGSYLWSLLR